MMCVVAVDVLFDRCYEWQTYCNSIMIINIWKIKLNWNFNFLPLSEENAQIKLNCVVLFIYNMRNAQFLLYFVTSSTNKIFKE